MKKNILKIIGIIVVITLILLICCNYAISKQKQRTVREMANKIQSSAEYYVMMQNMDNNLKETTINLAEENLLDIKGTIPKNGYVKITMDSKIEILYHYNGYCVSKSLNENNVKFNKMTEKECLKK